MSLFHQYYYKQVSSAGRLSLSYKRIEVVCDVVVNSEFPTVVVEREKLSHELSKLIMRSICLSFKSNNQIYKKSKMINSSAYSSTASYTNYTIIVEIR